MAPHTLLLAAPRGFCAGVDRAVLIVEKALEAYGAPVYVRHEIVHNTHVVESLRREGAVFVEDETEVPEGRSWCSPPTGRRPRRSRTASACSTR
jgi:4-hydroxy-3-methylbut-2-en-1-yl diphosphate reductase